jgi:hypothetical protein
MKQNSNEFKSNKYTEGLKLNLPRCGTCCLEERESEFCLISEMCPYHHPSDEEMEVLLKEIEESKNLNSDHSGSRECPGYACKYCTEEICSNRLSAGELEDSEDFTADHLPKNLYRMNKSPLYMHLEDKYE